VVSARKSLVFCPQFCSMKFQIPPGFSHEPASVASHIATFCRRAPHDVHCLCTADLSTIQPRSIVPLRRLRLVITSGTSSAT
jgi:hypothetical protein